MKPKTMILMIVAVSCGLGASYMTSRLLAERGAETEKVTILVAKKNLNMGDVIKVPEEMFIEKQFTKGDEPRMALVELDKLKGRQLKRSLRSGDHVTPDDLINDKDATGLWATLPVGHRAVGIRVNPDTIAGGFASLPHSRVDVINTVRRGDDRSTYSEIILEDILVLAADTQTQRDDTGRAMPANVVTLALKPEDALKIELAKNLGTISLVLRKFNDKGKTVDPKLSFERLRSGRAGSEPALEDISDSPPANVSLPQLPKEEKPAKIEGPRRTLTIYDGEKVKQIQFALPVPPAPPGSELQPSEDQPQAPAAAPKKE